MDCGTTEKKEKGKRDTTKYHCPHGMNKSFCIPCGRNGICVHKRNKYTCKECKGSDICAYGKQKYFCGECGGSQLRKTPHCTTIKNSK